MIVFLQTEEDMEWLRDVHLPNLPDKYQSAVLTGNEDCPSRVECYERADPLYTDRALVFVCDDERRLVPEQAMVEEELKELEEGEQVYNWTDDEGQP